MVPKKHKIGRNDPCPCGSGIKYKKCHLGNEQDLVLQQAKQQSQELEAKEHQRKEQQGLGREIISTKHKDMRVVATGSEIFYSPKWETFYDFLSYYIKKTLGFEWGNEELKKDFSNRHPVLQWYHYWCELQAKNKTKTGKVFSTPHIGASIAYFGLAYNLYLLQHNKGVQTELIRRVKLNDLGNFYGAIYETYVAAHFVKAGFDIEFENELDGSTSHCEFTATHKKSGRKFSVEAKANTPKSKGRVTVVSKLRAALKKNANHERIVFIDIGKPAKDFDESLKLLSKAQTEIRKLENDPALEGGELPEAYAIITNNSYWHDLQGQNFKFSALGEGFKIPSFKNDYKDTIHNALASREKDKEVIELIESIDKHQDIPVTFDGENPEIILGEKDDETPPLIIGRRYLVSSNDGSEVPAVLHSVVVDEEEKMAIGAYNIEGGGFSIVKHPLSETEMSAYKKHPNTFFGKVEPKTRANSPLEFYDWVYEQYKNTPKEKLLEFMDNYPNQDELKKLSQKELAQMYCEGVTQSATLLKDSSKNGGK